MEIFAFLFFAIMIFVAISVLRFVFGVWRQARNIRNAFGKFADAANGADNSEKADRRERGKKFSKSDGEYVDFEEVTDTEPQPSRHDDAEDAAADESHTSADNFARESQISDAEYEEIK